MSYKRPREVSPDSPLSVSSSEEFQSCTEGSTDDERKLGHKAKKQHIDVLPTSTPIVTLSIEDLGEVLRILREHFFKSTDYFDLGLDLGLLYDTIDTIKSRCREDPKSCLRECLVKWLEKADKVKEKGGPTWYALIEALRSINKAVADAIDKEKHPACVIFATRLTDESDEYIKYFPDTVIELLVREKLIPAGCRDYFIIFKSLKKAVCINYKNLEKLFVILRKFDTTANVGIAIMNDYRHCQLFHDADNTEKSKAVGMLPDTDDGMVGSEMVKSKSVKIHIPSAISTTFKKRRSKLAATLLEINRIFIVLKTDIEQLKHFLRLHTYSDLRPRILKCCTTIDILELICEQCSLTDITLLEETIEHFKIDDAKPIIQEYKDSNKKAFGKLPLYQCLNEYFANPPALQCEEAVFVVNRSVDDYTIKDIRQFLEVAVEEISPKVTVVVIRKGNSFTIICSFPLTLSASLISTALTNLKVLKEKGIIKLTIGYCTVYDYKEDVFYTKEGEAKDFSDEELQDYIKSVYTSRGTLEQLLVSTSVQLMNSEEENKENSKEIDDLRKQIEELNTQLSHYRELSEKKKWPLESEKEDDTPTGKEVEETKETKSSKEETDETELLKETLEKQIKEEKLLGSKKFKEISDLKEKLNKSESEAAQLKDTITVLEKQLNEKDDGTELSQLRDTIEENENKITTMKATEVSLQQQLGEKDKTIATLQANERAYQTQANMRIPLILDGADDTIHIPPVDVIMTSFDKHKKQDEEWYSPAFYTHFNGYTMCLCVRYDEGNKSSEAPVKLYAHLMAGNNDDNLEWPFRGTLKVELRSQRNKSVVSFPDITFNDKESGKRVWNGVRVEAGIASSFVGEEKGIRFDSALAGRSFSEYLKNNNIILRVRSITVDSRGPPSYEKAPSIEEEMMRFEITDFSKHKKSNSERISKPFHTSKGYKFVLMVYPNGRDPFKGRSVSVFAHISQGDNDNQLVFPFRGKIVIQIENQLEAHRNHVEKMIEFTDKTDPEERYGARVTGLTTIFGSGHSHQGYGYHDMLRHEFLEFNATHKTEYLRNDTLIVRVAKIEDYN